MSLEAEIQVDHVIVRSVLPSVFSVIEELRAKCPEGELADRAQNLSDFWRDVQPHLPPQPSLADGKVLEVVQQAYCVVDDLLDVVPDVPKDLLLRAKKCLPGIWPNSLEQKPLAGKKK